MNTSPKTAIPDYSQPRPVQLQISCLNMRHKLMYCDERHAIPGMVDVHSDTRVYFCIETCESLGKDGKPVHPEDCHARRACYCNPLPESTRETPQPPASA